MADGLIKNTLSFRFPDGAAGPTLVEMARFVKAFDADKKSMESIYKISEEHALFIKFTTQEGMKEALAQNAEHHVFEYSNGEKVKLQMTIAGGITKYVRIFDLPPEVTDSDIAAVLGKYGSVKRLVREKFPADLELDMYTGVRGVYMDTKKEIPASLYFLNRRGRLYYEGLKQKCFLCKMEGHLKAECPQGKRKENRNEIRVTSITPEHRVTDKGQTNNRNGAQETVEQSGYAAAVKSTPKRTQEAQLELNLVPLRSNRQQPSAAVDTGNEMEGDGEHFKGFSSTDMDDTEAKSLLKRPHSPSSNGSSTQETDDEGTARANSRKQKHKVLEEIATQPKARSSSGKSPRGKKK